MIVEWFISIGVNMSAWFSSLFPDDFEVPPFFAGFDDQLNSVFSNVDGMGVWADWLYILAVVGVVILVWGIGLLVKLARAIAAHIPFFGGAG